MTPLQTKKLKTNCRGSRNALATTLGDFARTLGLIVAVLAGFTSVSRGQNLQAEKVYGWDFQRDDDRNSDHEADGWRRRRDREHPAYIDIKIVSRDEARAHAAIEEQLLAARIMHAIEARRWDGNYTPEIVPPVLAKIMDRYVLDNCLEISMDGGAAELVSPKFPMDPRFSYSLEADISCEGLDGHKAWIELQLLDQNGETIVNMPTRELSQTTPWVRTATEITTDTSPDLRWGRVCVKVEPKGQMLITGTARFDTIAIHRLPRLSLTTALPRHIAEVGQAFDVKCLAMGINGKCKSVVFELRDYKQEVISRESVALVTAAQPDDPSNRARTPVYVSSVAKSKTGAAQGPASQGKHETQPNGEIYDGQAVWNLQLFEPGLYRVRVDLGNSGAAQRREILIGVMPTREAVKAGPFGWSFKSFDRGLQPEEVPSLVERFGAGWLKFPVWFDMTDLATADRLVAMTERLQTLGCECVGRLDTPPASQRSLFGEGNQVLPAVTVFRDPTVWEPALEPVLTRMGLKLDWFQLGDDDDKSFMGLADLNRVVTDIRARMQTYSQELKLAINWSWLDKPQESTVSPWNAVHLSTTPQLTADELLAHANANSRDRVSRWVDLTPLPASRYELLDRVRDLTERMIAVKASGIDAAFVADVFDQDRGLFDPQKNLGEMLIPWTNLVTAIGEGQYMGSIELPGKSENHIFRIGQSGIMLLWNDSPQPEQLFFGESISAIDVWGKSIRIQEVASPTGIPEQRIEVSGWPVIVRGINIDVVRWRQRFEIAVTNLKSSIDAGQTLPLRIENTFPQTAVGEAVLACDSLLQGGTASMQMQLSRGTLQERKLPIALRPDASAGKHELRFDFDILADQHYKFSLFRSITLGLGDIEFQWDMTRDSKNQVTLRVELTNNTKQDVSFDCKFFPPGQPYQRFQILEAKPGDTMREITLNLTREQEAAQAWLRCEEIGTGRILNYRLEL